VVEGVATAALWPDLFGLCDFCARAATAVPAGSRGEPLLPDRDATFALGPAAPFGYEPGPLELAAPEIGLRSPHVVSRVGVAPRSERAAETARLFALDRPVVLTPVPALGEGEPEPSAELAVQLIESRDPRLMLRTEAWQYANEAAELLEQARSVAKRAELARMVAHEVASQGFWSVWATVLAERLRDPGLLWSIFAPAAPRPPGAAAAYQPAEVCFWAFPSTRDEWLVETAAWG